MELNCDNFQKAKRNTTTYIQCLIEYKNIFLKTFTCAIYRFIKCLSKKLIII